MKEQKEKAALLAALLRLRLEQKKKRALAEGLLWRGIQVWAAQQWQKKKGGQSERAL